MKLAHFRSALTSLTLLPERSRHECLALLLFMWVPMARMREPKPVRTGRRGERGRNEEEGRKEGMKREGEGEGEGVGVFVKAITNH